MYIPRPPIDQAVRPPRRGLIVLVWLAFCTLSIVSVRSTVAQAGAPSRTSVASRLNLAGLVNLAAQQANLQVDYNPADLEKITVAVRLVEGLAPEELWRLANQILGQHGFTTVRLPGADTLSVVRLGDAAGLARLEDAAESPSTFPAGFESRLIELDRRPAKEGLEAIKLVLSKPGGAVTAIGDGRQVVVSDLRPRIEQAIWMVQQLDVAAGSPLIERISTQHLAAAQVAAMVTSAVEAQKPLSDKPTRGSVRVAASGDDATLLLVAPPQELEFFRGLISQFDQPSDVATIAYPADGFELEEVAKLLDQSAREIGPRGSADRWKVVADAMTRTLVVTATPVEHGRIEAALERLGRTPPEARYPIRTYPIRNRSVDDVMGILRDLVSSGVLAANTSLALDGGFDASAASQRSSRDVLPPGAMDVLDTGPNVAGARLSDPSSRGTRLRDGSRSAAGARSAAPGAAPGSDQPSLNLSITADPATSTLIVSGEPRLLDQLETLLKTIDVRQPQVMLEILVLSLTDSDTLDLGVELEQLIRSGDTLIRLASLFGLGSLPLVPPVGGALPTPAGQGGTALVLRPGDYGVLVRALETLNEGRTLNIPRILVNNNEQGTLDSVLEVPYLSTNASTTVATTSFGGTEDAGTTVTIRPQIAAGDHMRLEYAVSVSSFVGESSDPSLPPPKQQSHLQSVVTIPDGATIAVGGLEIVTEGEAISQVPLIGDVPGLGELFKKRAKSTSRTRFFVFITPQVLRRENFEDLRHLGGLELREAGLDDGFPTVEPQVIR